MRHRHINDRAWSLEAIDPCLERGDLADWRALFAAVRGDREIGVRVLRIAAAHDIPGSSAMATMLVRHVWPELESTPAAV